MFALALFVFLHSKILAIIHYPDNYPGMKIIIPLLGHEEVRGSIASLLKSFRLLLHALFDLQDCLRFILKDKLVSFGRHNFTWFVPINNWLVHSIVNMGKEIENIFSKQKRVPAVPANLSHFVHSFQFVS